MEDDSAEAEETVNEPPDLTLQDVEVNGGQYPMQVEGPVSVDASRVTVTPDASTKAAVRAWNRAQMKSRDSRVTKWPTFQRTRPPSKRKSGKSYLISKLPKYRRESND